MFRSRGALYYRFAHLSQGDAVMAKKAPAPDYTVTYIVVALLLILAAGLVLTWLYLKRPAAPSLEVAYAGFGPLVIRGKEYAIVANLSVSTSVTDAGWAAQNKPKLDVILQEALAGADLQHLRAPDGLRRLQGALKDASNAALNTTKVREVLLTDFVVQSE